MIQGTDHTDRPITPQKPWWRRGSLWLFGVVLASCAVFAYPSISRWARSDRAIDGSRLRLATVVRGDLERDVTVEGRVVAAYHPTLFSPARGLVRLEVQPGQPVVTGQLLAVVESPELASRLEQERSTEQSIRSELERLTLAARQLDLENAQQVDLLEVRRGSAERAMARAQRTFDEGVTGAADYERAQDELAVVGLELEHARGRSEPRSRPLGFRPPQPGAATRTPAPACAGDRTPGRRARGPIAGGRHRLAGRRPGPRRGRHRSAAAGGGRSFGIRDRDRSAGRLRRRK